MTKQIGEPAEPPEQIAEFYTREACISCGSTALSTLDRGTFAREPHRTMLLQGIWGESPFPALKDCEWELVECETCDQIFHKRLLTEVWQDVRFTRWMTGDAVKRFELEHGKLDPEHVFHRTRRDVDQILCLEKLTRSVRGSKALRVLDFGCGWGRFITLAGLFGFEAYGIDRHEARRSVAGNGERRIFEDVEEFTRHVSDPVHIATMFQVLEHLDAPLDVLRSLHAVIAPGGYLILEVPDATGLSRLATDKDLELCGGLDHVNAFSPATLVGIAKRAGFEWVRGETAHVTADPLRLLKREARRLLRRLQGPTTEGVFRRV